MELLTILPNTAKPYNIQYYIDTTDDMVYVGNSEYGFQQIAPYYKLLTGETIGANTSGNSATSTKWGNIISFAGDDTVKADNIASILAIHANGFAYRFDKVALRLFLDSPITGDTFQSVFDRASVLTQLAGTGTRPLAAQADGTLVIGAATLEQVTDAGNSTNNSIQIIGQDNFDVSKDGITIFRDPESTLAAIINHSESTHGSYIEFNPSSTVGLRLAGTDVSYGLTLNNTTANTDLLAVFDGRVQVQNGTASSDAVNKGQLENYALSGTYTPTAPILTNASDVTTYKCHYTRIGNEVTVTGRILYTNVSGAAVSQINLTLPITSDLTDVDDLVGTGVTGATPTTFCIVTGDATNNQATLILGTTNAGDPWVSTFTFTYTVI